MELLHDGRVTPGLAGVSAGLDGYLSDVAAGCLGRVSDADVLAELRGLEVQLRRCAVVGHALITELEQRSVAGRLVMSSTAAVLGGLLRLSPGEAADRVQAARVCAPQLSPTGAPLPPVLPRLAAAQAEGVVSGEHTRVILAALGELPATVTAADRDSAEQHLVAAAATLAPRQVGLVGNRILAHLRPDPALTEAEQVRRRSFSLIANPDGSYTPRGRLTPTCGALLQTWLSPRSAPRPGTSPGDPGDPGDSGDGDRAGSGDGGGAACGASDGGGAACGASDGGGAACGASDGDGAAPVAVRGVPDPRSHGQRMHDALEELAGLAVRRTELLDSGAPAQVIITMTAEQFTNRNGLAETSFGQPLTITQALTLADEAAINLLIRDSTGTTLDHRRTRRIATRAQTLALIARDKGCTFPGCDKPPEWCQRHHITAWADGGTTDLDNLTLVCGHHHREFERAGWTCQMAHGQPQWTPPAWLDPTRTPRRNHRLKQ